MRRASASSPRPARRRSGSRAAPRPRRGRARARPTGAARPRRGRSSTAPGLRSREARCQTRVGPRVSRRRELPGPVHVHEQLRRQLDLGDVELGERVAELQLARREAPLEHRERAPAVRAGERAGLRDGGVEARGRELPQRVRRERRAVDRDDEAQLGRRRAQPGDEARRAARARPSRRRRARTAAAARRRACRPRAARCSTRRAGATRAPRASRRRSARAPSVSRTARSRRRRGGSRSPRSRDEPHAGALDDAADAGREPVERARRERDEQPARRLRVECERDLRLARAVDRERVADERAVPRVAAGADALGRELERARRAPAARRRRSSIATPLRVAIS